MRYFILETKGEIMSNEEKIKIEDEHLFKLNEYEFFALTDTYISDLSLIHI